MIMRIDRDLLKKYKILLADADDGIENAGRTLQRYAERATSVSIPIAKEANGHAVILSLTNGEKTNAYRNRLVSDGFATFLSDENIYITANTPRGVLYGVYDFLERFLGIRFLRSDCEYVPQTDAFEIPSELVSNPDFPMRTYLMGDTYEDNSKNKKADLEQLSKMRIKDVYMFVPKKYGGREEVYGRNINHNFHYFVPFEKYGNDHPEFYRFFYVNEEITPTIDLTNGITEDGKIDESMEVSVAKIVLEEMKKDVIAHPETEVFNFTQEDGPYYFDDQNNRRLEQKYKRSGILIRFCNAVVRELNRFTEKELGRTVKIITFAYAYTKDAPVIVDRNGIRPIDETVVADENLIIQLALMSNACFPYFDERQFDYLKKAQQEWRIVARELWFWAYDISFHRYFAYFDTFSHIDDNIEGFKKMGVSYLCMQGSHDCANNWQTNIRAYAYLKKMWDANLSAQMLIDEYIDLYYGVGADSVRRVMKLFHENHLRCMKEIEDYSVVTSGIQETAKCNPVEMLYAAVNVLEEGERAIENAPLTDEEKVAYQKRLALVKLTPLSLLYDNYYWYYPNASEDAYKRVEEKFFSVAEFSGAERIGENWTMEQYKNEGSHSAVMRKKEQDQQKVKIWNVLF